MKSNINENRYFVECSCHTPEHLLVFDFEDYNEDKGLSFMEVYLTLDWKRSFKHRVKQALKFVFNRKPLLTSDSVVITYENVEALKEAVLGMEKFLDKQKTITYGSGRQYANAVCSKCGGKVSEEIKNQDIAKPFDYKREEAIYKYIENQYYDKTSEVGSIVEEDFYNVVKDLETNFKIKLKETYGCSYNTIKTAEDLADISDNGVNFIVIEYYVVLLMDYLREEMK